MFTQAYLDTVETMQQVQRSEKAAQAEKDFKHFVAKKSKNRAKKRCKVEILPELRRKSGRR